MQHSNVVRKTGVPLTVGFHTLVHCSAIKVNRRDLNSQRLYRYEILSTPGLNQTNLTSTAAFAALSQPITAETTCVFVAYSIRIGLLHCV